MASCRLWYRPVELFQILALNYSLDHQHGFYNLLVKFKLTIFVMVYLFPWCLFS